MSGFTSFRYDFNRAEILKNIAVIASSYRCGSTYFGLRLWETGACGAPTEYFNYEREIEIFKARLGVESPDDFIDALLKIRTGPNGIFSVKSHFYHFKSIWDRSERWRSLRPNMRFIYVDRKNKIAQAVSMAKAVQDNAWTALMDRRQVPLFYSADLVERCLQEVMVQTEAWWGWFGEQDVQPYIVNYEEFVRDPSTGVQRVLDWLGVENDAAGLISVPILERQSSEVNADWERQFRDHLRNTRK